MTIEEKQDYLYDYCDGRSCDTCVLNKSEHMWLTQCDEWKCPSFLEITDYELDKAIKKIQVSKDLDKAHDTTKLAEAVNHPSHYNDGKIEVIDFIEDKGLGFCLGNAVKYISRAGKKDKSKEAEDIKKAIWYLNRYLKQLGVCAE